MAGLSVMTGREAIYLVRSASLAQVTTWRDETPDATLRAVCLMRLHEPHGWPALLRDLGLVELPDLPPKTRAIELWKRDYWTASALAKETGLSRNVLENMRRRTLKGSTWAVRYDGHRPAYRLMASAAST